MVRIGPKMRLVQEFVRANPGCSKLAAAEHVGPRGSRGYGYETVDRALGAGLIRAERGDAKTYRLYVVD